MIVTSIGNNHLVENFDTFNCAGNGITFNKDVVMFTNDPTYEHNNNIVFSVQRNQVIDRVHDLYYEISSKEFADVSHNKKIGFIDEDRIKVLIPRCHGGFGHFILDTIGLILQAKRHLKNPFFIINVNGFLRDMWSSKDRSNEIIFLSFLKQFLDTEKIEYQFLKGNFFIAVNNFYSINWLEHTDQLYADVSNSFYNIINKNNILPTKKVYIKSKYYSDNINKNIKSNSLSIDDLVEKRIVNEKYLEKYLIDNGFESLDGETFFTSMEQQLNYFYEVKTIFSVTGSGLVNMLFMQPGGNVIELMSPMFRDPNSGGYHLHSSLYQNISYSKQHNYFAKKNLMDGKLIVEDIKNNPKFLEMIK